MYAKPLELPFHILQYQACLNRLDQEHPARNSLDSRYNKTMTGYRGEALIAYYLDTLPENDYFLFHNLRFEKHAQVFQIDWLILTQRFFLILEVKHIKGKLIFESDCSQMLREIDGQIDVFDDPVLQVERSEDLLSKWIESHQEAALPSESRAVITSNAQLEIRNNQNPSMKLIRKSALLKEMNQINYLHRDPVISKKNLSLISRFLLKSNHPLVLNLFSSYKELKPRDIIRGVQCPDCSHFHLIRNKRSWYCPKCRHFSKDAHIAALRDYLLLFGSRITNKQCRAFLMIKSSAVAKRLLHEVCDHFDGEKKGRVYYLAKNLLISDKNR
ncbi:nuclease-related domain-containing protein [Sporolactobacillus vineae]|uniref:nuclease-related domain-containing protein n=1 Tax=Sporolactobacillus vineae TaxID=444463 RepID=UPI000288887C|nr:nuclease-related domain-containing protein [Sporolactobacillus vineae]